MEEKILIKSESESLKFVWISVALTVLAPIAIIALRHQCVTVGRVWYEYPAYSFIFIPLAIASWIIHFSIKSCELTITDKRAYGKAIFGRRVDLPMDLISAVGYSMFNGIGISTSSGSIKFAFIKNRDAIQKVLSEQLVERQSISKNKAEQNIEKNTTIEELKQYKELLDNGVITQEEFEQKKSQLLNN